MQQCTTHGILVARSINRSQTQYPSIEENIWDLQRKTGVKGTSTSASSSDKVPKDTDNVKEDDVSEQSNKGHGRYSADDYVAAEVHKVSDERYYPGAHCLHVDCKGRLYLWNKPSKVIRLLGQPMARVVRYDREVYRCGLCLTLFTVPLPKESGKDVYSDSFKAVLAVNHYVFGLPFYRIAKYHEAQGIPLPTSNQFACMETVFNHVLPVYQALQRTAANGELVQYDDTTAKVQSLVLENQALEEKARRGIFTTAALSKVGDNEVVLVFTGRSHGGENITALLRKRDTELGSVILMSDALSRNRIKDESIAEQTQVSYCLTHARRYFFECKDVYPKVCQPVLNWIGQVYRHERHCKTHGYTPEQRLHYHRRHSKPIMKQLRRFLEQCVRKRWAEPNSSAGKAINYMRNHFRELTLFLSVLGAVLDNNDSERLIKIAPVMYRKNSQQYRTTYGAMVGDMLMSVLFTAQYAGVDPVDYLQSLLLHKDELQQRANDWLPWHYKDTLNTKALAKAA